MIQKLTVKPACRGTFCGKCFKTKSMVVWAELWKQDWLFLSFTKIPLILTFFSTLCNVLQQKEHWSSHLFCYFVVSDVVQLKKSKWTMAQFPTTFTGLYVYKPNPNSFIKLVLTTRTESTSCKETRIVGNSLIFHRWTCSYYWKLFEFSSLFYFVVSVISIFVVVCEMKWR